MIPQLVGKPAHGAVRNQGDPADVAMVVAHKFHMRCHGADTLPAGKLPGLDQDALDGIVVLKVLVHGAGDQDKVVLTQPAARCGLDDHKIVDLVHGDLDPGTVEVAYPVFCLVQFVVIKVPQVTGPHEAHEVDRIFNPVGIADHGQTSPGAEVAEPGLQVLPDCRRFEAVPFIGEDTDEIQPVVPAEPIGDQRRQYLVVVCGSDLIADLNADNVVRQVFHGCEHI